MANIFQERATTGVDPQAVALTDGSVRDGPAPISGRKGRQLDPGLPDEKGCLDPHVSIPDSRRVRHQLRPERRSSVTFKKGRKCT